MCIKCSVIGGCTTEFNPPYKSKETYHRVEVCKVGLLYVGTRVSSWLSPLINSLTDKNYHRLTKGGNSRNSGSAPNLA